MTFDPEKEFPCRTCGNGNCFAHEYGVDHCGGHEWKSKKSKDNINEEKSMEAKDNNNKVDDIFISSEFPDVESDLLEKIPTTYPLYDIYLSPVSGNFYTSNPYTEEIFKEDSLQKLREKIKNPYYRSLWKNEDIEFLYAYDTVSEIILKIKPFRAVHNWMSSEPNIDYKILDSSYAENYYEKGSNIKLVNEYWVIIPQDYNKEAEEFFKKQKKCREELKNTKAEFLNKILKQKDSQ